MMFMLGLLLGFIGGVMSMIVIATVICVIDDHKAAAGSEPRGTAGEAEQASPTVGMTGGAALCGVRCAAGPDRMEPIATDRRF